MHTAYSELSDTEFFAPTEQNYKKLKSRFQRILQFWSQYRYQV